MREKRKEESESESDGRDENEGKKAHVVFLDARRSTSGPSPSALATGQETPDRQQDVGDTAARTKSTERKVRFSENFHKAESRQVSKPLKFEERRRRKEVVSHETMAMMTLPIAEMTALIPRPIALMMFLVEGRRKDDGGELELDANLFGSLDSLEKARRKDLPHCE